MATEEVFTPEVVAEKLSISPKTVRDWLRAGKIKGIKVGKAWRVKETDLNHFINQKS